MRLYLYIALVFIGDVLGGCSYVYKLSIMHMLMILCNVSFICEHAIGLCAKYDDDYSWCNVMWG